LLEGFVMRLTCVVAVTSALLAAVAAPCHAADADWSGVADALGKSGKEMPDGVYRVGLPRTDLHVTLDNVSLLPGFALGGWLAFQRMGEQAVVMGDLVLLQEEVNPVMSKLLGSGIMVTAVHNHLLRADPLPFYMHIEGRGGAATLAAALHDALGASKTPLGAAPARSAPPAATEAGEFDTARLDADIGSKGTLNGGVYQFAIPRAETISDGGMPVPPAMGTATAINFQHRRRQGRDHRGLCAARQ
jgi:hypothetical protein